MTWRVAKSLDKLLSQINTLAPNRSTLSDGSIGDAAHATTDSDHNPHVKDGDMGVVTARDFTHDPMTGADMERITEALRKSKDTRIKYCLVPGTRILGTDLRWRPIETLTEGDEILAFDEWGTNPRTTKAHAGARMRSGTVEAVQRFVLPCFEIVTDKGTVVASKDHMWLAARAYQGSYRLWRRTDALQVGDQIQYFADPWDVETSYEAGWLAGLFDGEGCLSRAQEKRGGWGLQVSQRPGPTLDFAQELLSRLKFQTAAHKNGAVVGLHIRGGLPQVLRLLGSIPTQRLYAKAVADAIWEDHAIMGTWPTATVHDIRPIGEQEVVAIQSSTRTLLAEGMFSHNCIWNSRMFSSYPTSSSAPFTWRLYTGSNPHTKHAHVSVQPQKNLYDATRDWAVPKPEKKWHLKATRNGIVREVVFESWPKAKEWIRAKAKQGWKVIARRK